MKKTKTIISASRRTDLPAFYYDWLQRIFKKGEVELRNQIYPERQYSVNLGRESVGAVVLWSKNFKHFADDPGVFKDYNMYFQYSINNYSTKLEPNVPTFTETLKTLEKMRKNYSDKFFNIRFDPIIISKYGEIIPDENKPGKARLQAFENLCKNLKELDFKDCRITTSYVSLYGSIENTLRKLNIGYIPLSVKEQLLFFERMTDIAKQYGFTVYSCADKVLESVNGMKKGSCIDGKLLSELFGEKFTSSKDSSQRETCGCTKSRDIGSYLQPCRHMCKYCYAR